MWKRNQSMAAQIAKFDFVDRVIFVNPIRSLRSARAGRPGRNESPSKPGIDILPTKQGANIWVYSPFRFLPFKRFFPMLERMEDHIFYQVINRMNRGRPFLLLINDPIKSSDYLLQNLC